MSESPIQWLRPEVILDELFNQPEHVAAAPHELGETPTTAPLDGLAPHDGPDAGH